MNDTEFLDFTINLSKKNSEFIKFLTRINSENEIEIKLMDDYFTILEDSLDPFYFLQDDDKLLIFLNYFNIKICHQLLFKYWKEKSYPSTNLDWMKFLISTKFKLFGFDSFSLYTFDLLVLR